jgi:hypothetical protein
MTNKKAQLSQLLEEQQQRSPLLDQMSKEDLEKIVNDELAFSEGSKLQSTFEAYESPHRLRVIDREGNLYDILQLPNGKIGIEFLENRTNYLGVKPYYSWEEAEESLPEGWEALKAVNANEENPYIKKWCDESPPRKSKGHIKFFGDFEFFDRDGEVYRANINNVFDLDGYRHGRWESSRAHFDQYESLFQ